MHEKEKCLRSENNRKQKEEVIQREGQRRKGYEKFHKWEVMEREVASAKDFFWMKRSVKVLVGLLVGWVCFAVPKGWRQEKRGGEEARGCSWQLVSRCGSLSLPTMRWTKYTAKFFFSRPLKIIPYMPCFMRRNQSSLVWKKADKNAKNGRPRLAGCHYLSRRR